MIFHAKNKILILIIISIFSISLALGEANRYKKGDHVEVYVNKVGPYWNPVILFVKKFRNFVKKFIFCTKSMKLITFIHCQFVDQTK